MGMAGNVVEHGVDDVMGDVISDATGYKIGIVMAK